jgi:hypothetical protein
MDEQGLTKYLMECMEERKDKKIEQLLSEILDEYFCDEIA